MKIFKLDLMTVLIVVVTLGVALTMTGQANDRGINEVVSAPAVKIALSR